MNGHSVVNLQNRRLDETAAMAPSHAEADAGECQKICVSSDLMARSMTEHAADEDLNLDEE